jgi:preprotein translocase subunit SecE
MDKVSWPSRQDLQRATTVVIVTMLFIGFVLLAYDVFWAWFFTLIRILKPA